jgi:DNA-binding SARP family transcriptional activator
MVMVVLKLFGGASLERADGVYTGPSVQRHRIALLAVLATSRSRPVPREKLMALLWPERDAEQARRLLNQSVYVLRKAVGNNAILSAADALRLDAGSVGCDLIDFEDAVASGQFERAAEIYSGPFLDGFFLNDAPDLERWVEEKRTRLLELQAKVLEDLAEAADGRGERQSALRWWKALVAHNPCDSRAVLRLMHGLESAGDPAGALLQATAHQRMLQEELGVGLPPDIGAMVEGLRGFLTGAGAIPLPGRPASRPVALVTPPEGQGQRDGAEAPGKAGAARRVKPLAAYGALAAALVVIIAAMSRLGPFHRGADSPPPEVRIPEAQSDAADPQASGGPLSLPPERRTASIAAYELYKLGSDPVVLRDGAAARQALEHLRQAVALDPSYAAAWAELARMSWRVAARNPGVIPSEDGYLSALDAARRAVALDDSLPAAHATLGLLQMIAFDFSAAENSFTRAVALEPSHSLTRQWLAVLYLWTARPAAALAEAEWAAALDPLSPAAQVEVASALAANGRCQEALARLDRLAAVEPPLLRVPLVAAHCMAQLEMWESAISELRNTADRLGPLAQAFLGYLLARSGARDEALQILEALRDPNRPEDGGAFPVALVYAGLGDVDETLRWLERSIDDRSLWASNQHFAALQPILDLLDGNPRLERLAPLAPLADLRARQRSARVD